MRTLVAILILVCASANAADITIADFSKGYEHKYQNCTINLSDERGYLYANCNNYSAPFIGYQQTDWTSKKYDEVGINGVYWHGCRMAGDGLNEVRFECRVRYRSMIVRNDAFNQNIQLPFRFYEVVYNPDR